MSRPSAIHAARPATAQAVLIGHARRARRLAAVVVAAVAGFVFIPTIVSGQFVNLDDGQYVLQNDRVTRPTWAGAWAFAAELRRPATVAGYYQPLTMWSLMLDSWLIDGPPDPRMFHFTNVLLHALNSVLVFLILHTACGGLVTAAACAVLFAVHPLQVESVAWISQRKTVLSGLGSLLAVWLHLRYGLTGAPRWRWGAAAAYAAALLAKPTALFVPLVMVLLDYWPLRRYGRRSWTEKWPLWALMAAAAAVTVVSQSATANLGAPNLGRLPDLARLCAFNVTLYLLHAVWPASLSLMYPIPENLGWSNVSVTASVAFIMAAVIAWATCRRRAPAVFVGLGSAAVLLGLAAGPVRFYQSCVGDRFMYLPLAGLLLPVAAAGRSAWRSGRHAASGLPGPRGWAALVAVLLVMVPLVRLNFARQEAWADTERLWSDVLRTQPNLPIANASLAEARLAAAEDALRADARDEAARLLSEALERVDLALRGEADVAAHHRLRAEILLRLNRGAEALAAAQRAVEIGRGPAADADAVTLCKALLANGQVEEACARFDRALSASPDMPLALRIEMGDALARAGEFTRAAAYHQQSAAAHPDRAEVFVALGGAAAAGGDWPRAAQAYLRARDLLVSEGIEAPAITLALGKVLLELNQPDAAADLFVQPAVLENFPAQCRFGLAGVAALRGDAQAAVEQLAEALRLDPRLAEVARNKAYFAALHGHPRWGALVGATASQPAASRDSASSAAAPAEPSSEPASEPQP